MKSECKGASIMESRKIMSKIMGSFVVGLSFMQLLFSCAEVNAATREQVAAKDISSNTVVVVSDNTVPILYSGKSGDLDWSIDANGLLKVNGTGDYGEVYDGEDIGAPSWLTYSDVVTSAKISVKGMTNTYNMFAFCKNMKTVQFDNFDTSEVVNMEGMFLECNSLEDLDVTEFDTGNVTNMSGMFAGCKNLTSLDVSKFNTSMVTNMSSMFMQCSGLKNLDLSKFDTHNVTNFGAMFLGCYELENVDVSNFNTEKAENMAKMFLDCYELENLNVSNFKAENVEDMSYMFAWCKKLKRLDSTNFSCEKVKDMSYMFFYCENLQELNISNFNTKNLQKAEKMLWGLNSLESVKFPANVIKEIELPYMIVLDKETNLFGKNSKMVWKDENQVICQTAHCNLTTPMTYTKVSKSSGQTSSPEEKEEGKENNSNTNPQTGNNQNQDKNPPTPSQGKQDATPAKKGTKITSETISAKFTVTSADIQNPTVAYTGTTNKKKKTITIPDTITYEGVKYTVTSISAKAFKGNKKLTTVKIGSNVTKIDNGAFEGCTSLKTVTIGKGLKTIGKNTFKNCKKLKSLTIKSSNLKTVGKNALKGIHAKCKIKVPSKKVNAYKKLFKGKGQKKTVKITK